MAIGVAAGEGAGVGAGDGAGAGAGAGEAGGAGTTDGGGVGTGGGVDSSAPHEVNTGMLSIKAAVTSHSSVFFFTVHLPG